MSKKSRNLRRNINLGAFLILCLAGLTFLSIRLRGGFGLGPQQTWVAYFGRDSTVKKDSEIYVSGTKVGRVTDVTLVPDEEIAPGRHVKVTLSIRKDLSLWEGAQVILASRGLLGRTILELYRGTPDPRTVLTPDTPLPGRIAQGPFDGLAELIEGNRKNIDQFTSDLAEISGRFRRGESTAGRLFTDDALYRKVERITDNVLEITEAARSQDTTLGRLLNDRELYDRVTTSVRNVEEITAQVRSGKGLLGRALYDEELAADIHDTAKSVRNITNAVEKGEGTLGRFIYDNQLHDVILETARSVRNLVGRVETGGGSLSQLIDDKGQLYENFSLFAENLRVMSDDVRAGKGSLGLFLRDDSLYRELQRTFESFRETGEITRESAHLASLVSFTSLFFNVLN